MKNKSRVLPAVAVIGGILGLLIRRLYLTRGFDASTGLSVSQPYGAVLAAAVLAVLAALILLSRGEHRNFDGKYSSAFYSARPFWFVLSAAGGVLMIAAGILNLMTWLGRRSADPYAVSSVGTAGVIRPVLGVVCLLAGAGIYFTALEMRRKGECRSAWISLPGFACCLWVMACYQSFAKDPVTGHYLLRLLAVLAAMAGCYCMATFAFGKGRVALTLVLDLMGAALGIMVLGDGQPLSDVSLQLGLVFYLLSMAGCLAANDGKPALPEGCAPADCRTCPGCPPVPPAPAKPAEPDQ